MRDGDHHHPTTSARGLTASINQNVTSDAPRSGLGGGLESPSKAGGTIPPWTAQPVDRWKDSQEAVEPLGWKEVIGGTLKESAGVAAAEEPRLLSVATRAVA